MVKLGDVCEILSGYAFDSKLFTDKHNDMPLVRIRDVVRGFTQTYTTEDYNEKYVVKKGDLLIGMDGEFNIAPWNSENALLNQRVCKIKSVSDRLDENYLLYFMPKALKKIEQMTSFVTVKHLSAKTINQIEIPLTPLDIQKHIADTLDKTQEIIDGHKKQLEELDNLIKATFYDMFGDFRDCTRYKLIDLIYDGAGLSYGIVQPGEDIGSGVGVIRPIDIEDGIIIIDQVKKIPEEIEKPYKKTRLNGNEILITVRGTTGDTAMTNSKCIGMNVTRGIAVIRQNDKIINIVFLNEYLKSTESQRYIQENTKGATLKQINLSQLKEQNIPLPPLDLQNKFAQIVTNIEQQKFLVKQSIAQSQNLFNSLMSKYFDH